MDINQAIKEAAEAFITEQSGTSQGSLNNSVIEALKLYVTDKGGTPATSSINDLVNQATAYYFSEQSVSPAPRGNDAIFKATELYLTAKSEYVPKSFNERLLASAGYFITNGSGTTTIAAPFASVNGPTTGPSGNWAYESWSVQYATQPTLTENVPFTVERTGYNTSGAVATRRELMYVVKSTSLGGAVRKPYPNHAQQSLLTAAISDYIYADDVLFGGAINNSTFVSPKPVVNWGTGDRRLIGNSIGGSTIPIHVIPFHRNAGFGQEVACVTFQVSGLVSGIPTTLPDVVVGTCTAVSLSGDKNTVYGFALPTTDITTFDTGSVTVNAKAYPWVGGAASISDSSTGATRRDFCTQYFYKNASKYAAPDIIYVNATTGVDATAQVNNPLLPALTVVGAINRMRTGSTGAPWNTATTQIVIAADGTYVGGGTGSGSSTGQLGGLVITRDPATTTRAGVILQLGAASFNANMTTAAGPGTFCTIFSDVSFTRGGGALNPFRGTSFELQIENCEFNCSALTSAWLSSSGTAQSLVLIGTTITNNSTGGGFGAVLYAKQYLWRGVTVTTPGTVEVNTLIGCEITTPSSFAAASGLTQDNTIVAYNKLLRVNTSVLNIGSAPNGAAIVQNLWEFIGTTTTQFLGLAVSNDGGTGSTSHVIIHNNTFTGAYGANRNNVFYNDGVSNTRTNTLQSVVGNIFVGIATKGDVYVGVNEAGQPWAADAPTRIWNWGFLYGAGCRNNFTQYIDASSGGLGSSFSQAYEGIESNWGTSNTTRNDPLFVSDQTYPSKTSTTYSGGTSGTYSAGSGSGNYHVTSSSPCKGANSNAVLPGDLEGTARSLTLDTIGVYVAA